MCLQKCFILVLWKQWPLCHAGVGDLGMLTEFPTLEMKPPATLRALMKSLLWDSSTPYLIGWLLRAGERSGYWRTLRAGKPENILFTAKAPRFTGFETVVTRAIFAVFPRHISYAGDINYIHYADYNQILSLISFIGARLYIRIGMHKHGDAVSAPCIWPLTVGLLN